METAYILRQWDSREYSIKGETRLGRSPPCEILVGDPRVEPLHATFWVQAGALLVRDEGSAAGTVVNETRLQPRQAVQLLPGDVLRLGDAAFTVAEGEGAAAAREAGTGVAPPREMRFILQGSTDQEYPIDEETRIGRNPDCQVFLSDAWVSRQHATVWVSEGTLYVRDDNSRIGTFVNEARIAPGQATALRLGDQIRVGVTLLTVAGTTAPAVRLPDPTLLARRSPPDPTGPIRPGPGDGGFPGFDFAVRLAEGRDYRIEGETRIGREPPCEILLADQQVSEHHATLWSKKGTLYVRDEFSSNGTLVNGSRIASGQAYPLRAGDSLLMGESVLSIVSASAEAEPPRDTPGAGRKWDTTEVITPAAPEPPPAPAAYTLQAADGEEFLVTGKLRLGREPSCEVVLSDPLVSRFHAVVLVQQGRLFVRDEGSRNGTFVGDVRVGSGQSMPLRAGDRVKVGNTVFTVGRQRPADGS